MHYLPDLETSKDLQRERESRLFSAAFVNCLRGKISLCELLTLSYPLSSKGELRLGRSCWGTGGSSWGSICARSPTLLAHRRAGNSSPIPPGCSSSQMPQTLHSHYNKSWGCQLWLHKTREWTIASRLNNTGHFIFTFESLVETESIINKNDCDGL